MTRFYIEGNEVDVQDPVFYICTEELKEHQDSINNLLNTEDYDEHELLLA